MNLNKSLVLVLLVIAILTFTATSQAPPPTTISIEELKTCNTIFYNETQPVYGTCVYYHNATSCLNATGPDTDCSVSQTQRNFRCQTGQLVTKRNSTECSPLNKFTVTISRGSITEKKEIDFSDWGACIYNKENDCMVVTCQSRYDGANDGQFHGCTSGTSCQKFEICENKIKVSYKNSRENFVEEDPTFHLAKLALKEVEQ